MGINSRSQLEGEPSLDARTESVLHLSQVTGDIEANWASVASIINLWVTLIFVGVQLESTPLLILIISNSFITQATDFYSHNDMDMVRALLVSVCLCMY